MKIALVISGLVIVGAIVYYFVQRATAQQARAVTGGTPTQSATGIDPVTGQRWQTVAEAQHQIDATSATSETTSLLH